MSDRVIVEMSVEQARITANALDLLSRIGMGQIEEIVHYIRQTFTVDPAYYEAMDNGIRSLKQMIGQPRNGHKSISSADILARNANDLHCVIRKAVAEAENHHRMSVWRDGLVIKYGDQPLAKADVVRGDVE